MTESDSLPTVRRWQSGYEIPVQITTETRTDEMTGTARTVYLYRRVVVPALTALDIAASVERDHGGDPAILAEAAMTAAATNADLDQVVDTLAFALGVTL